jgi:hypothetical protein
MLSLSLGPKVIRLSGAYCNSTECKKAAKILFMKYITFIIYAVSLEMFLFKILTLEMILQIIIFFVFFPNAIFGCEELVDNAPPSFAFSYFLPKSPSLG